LSAISSGLNQSGKKNDLVGHSMGARSEDYFRVLLAYSALVASFARLAIGEMSAKLVVGTPMPVIS